MNTDDNNKNIWMAMKAIALDSGYYTKYIWKGVSKPKNSDKIKDRKYKSNKNDRRI